MDISVRLTHPEATINYLRILFQFWNIANGQDHIKDPNQTIQINGIYDEYLQLEKDHERYAYYIDDGNEEKTIKMTTPPTLEEFIDAITFPVAVAEYHFGGWTVAQRKFTVPKAEIPLEVIEIQNTEDYRRNATLLPIGDKDIGVVQECFKQYRLTNFLGKGNNGSVYRACIGEDCIYAIKIIIIQAMGSIAAHFVHESSIIRQLSENGIGPAYFGSWICKVPSSTSSFPITFGCLVTEMWDGELLPTDCLPNNLIDKLQTQIVKLHALGYLHTDIFLKNVLVKRRNNQIVDVTLNDFGTVRNIEEWKVFYAAGYGNDFFNHNYMMTPQNSQLFLDNNLNINDVIAYPILLDDALIYYLRKNCK